MIWHSRVTLRVLRVAHDLPPPIRIPGTVLLGSRVGYLVQYDTYLHLVCTMYSDVPGIRYLCLDLSCYVAGWVEFGVGGLVWSKN